MDAFKQQEALKPYFENAHGFAVFETVAKVGIGLGVAAGKGCVYVNNNAATEGEEQMMIGEATLMQVSIGLQFGGQVYSEIIFFETARDLENFTKSTSATAGNFEFEADMNVVALTASASAKITSMGNQGLTAGVAGAKDLHIQPHACEYVKGMKVYTLTRAGLMYQATIAGQKFTYKPATTTAGGGVGEEEADIHATATE
jgi:lipid-binding SYLF domain-containing protein